MSSNKIPPGPLLRINRRSSGPKVQPNQLQPGVLQTPRGRQLGSGLDQQDSFTSSGSYSPTNNQAAAGVNPNIQGADSHPVRDGADGTDSDVVCSMTEPLVKQDVLTESVLEDKQARLLKWHRHNIVRILIGLALALTSVIMFIDTFIQWVYWRFEEDVFGGNHTEFNTTIIDGILRRNNPCTEDNSSFFSLKLSQAQSEASAFLSWTLLSEVGPALISCTFLGAWSSIFGRKILFVLPLIGGLVKMGVACCVAYWHLPLGYLYIGSIVFGMSGSIWTVVMGAFVYMADSTDHGKSRSFCMVVVHVVMTVCYAMSHLGVGYFITAFQYFWPLFTAMCLNVAAILWFMFIVRETVNTQSFASCRNRWEMVKDVLRFYFVKNEETSHSRLDFILLGIIFLLFGTSMTLLLDILFLMDRPLCWDSAKIGLVISIKGTVSGASAIVLAPLLQLVLREEYICTLALVSGAFSRLLMAFSLNDMMVYLAFGLAVGDSMVQPFLLAILSRMVPATKWGSLFASTGVINVLTLLISEFGISFLYSKTVIIWRGLAFVVIAGCFLVAGGLMMLYTVNVSRRNPWRNLVILEVDSSGIFSHDIPRQEVPTTSQSSRSSQSPGSARSDRISEGAVDPNFDVDIH